MTMEPTRLPPHDPNAEESLLAGVLRWNDPLAELLNIVATEDFYSEVNRRIWSAMVVMFTRAARIDMATLWDELQASGQSVPADYRYLVDLWDSRTTGNGVAYAKIVHDKAVVRRLHHAGAEIARDAFDSADSPEALLSAAEGKIFAIAQGNYRGDIVSLGRASEETMDRINERSRPDADRKGAIPTGLIDLDRITLGMHPSELTILAARPSVGKTAMALNIAYNVAIGSGLPVFFVSLEQSRLELCERLYCIHGRLDSHRIRASTLRPEDCTRLVQSFEDMQAAPDVIQFDDRPCQSMVRISSHARQLKLSKGIRLVIVDYLQLVEPETRRGDSRQEQVAGIGRRLKQLARELQLPVLAMAQLNRGIEERANKMPRLSDLRESGSLEQDADTVILLHKAAQQQTAVDILEVSVGKNRNGRTGDLTLAFEKAYMRVTNVGGQQ